MNGLKLEVGKNYRTRDGQKADVREINFCDRYIAFVPNALERGGVETLGYEEDGTFAGNRNTYGDVDLIAEWQEDRKPLPNETWYFDGEEESPVRIVGFASSGSPVIEFLHTDEENGAIEGEIAEFNEAVVCFVELYSPTITKPKTVVKWTYAFVDEYNDMFVDVDIYDTEEAAIEDFEKIRKEDGYKLIQTIKIEYTPEGK